MKSQILLSDQFEVLEFNFFIPHESLRYRYADSVKEFWSEQKDAEDDSDFVITMSHLALLGFERNDDMKNYVPILLHDISIARGESYLHHLLTGRLYSIENGRYKCMYRELCDEYYLFLTDKDDFDSELLGGCQDFAED